MSKEKKLASNVAELRKQAGLTQKQLAELTGTTVVTVANWENNRTGVDQLLRVAKLCKALKCSPDDLVNEIEAEE